MCWRLSRSWRPPAYVYSIKYQTIFAAEEVVKTRHLIAKERNSISILRAEYAHLARPDRIQGIADAALAMQPLALTQIAKPSELPEKAGKVELDWSEARGARPRRRERNAEFRRHRRHAFAEVAHDRAPASHARAAKPANKPKKSLLPKLGAVSLPKVSLPKLSLKRLTFASVAALMRGAKGFVTRLFTSRGDLSGPRIAQLAFILGLAYVGIGGKLLRLGLSNDPPQTLKSAADEAVSGARPDLLDRNGEILAADVKTMSVFAEPKRIIDKDEAVELITAVLPDVDARELRERLSSKKGFIWIKRQVTPKEQAEIFHLGLPGVGFVPENKRVYPNGRIAAHVVGYVDKDNIGIAGMEKYLDEQSLTDPHVPGFAIDPHG